MCHYMDRVIGLKDGPSLLLDILDRDAVYDRLFAHFTPKTIHDFSRICRAARRAVVDYNLRARDVNQLLAHFVPRPVEFRRMQMYTGMVISGSTALQFFDRTLYKESDLDLYIAVDWAETVGCWIEGAEMDYKFAPREDQRKDFLGAFAFMKEHGSEFADQGGEGEEAYQLQGISGVFTFVRESLTVEKGEKLEIQLIVCDAAPFETIAGFHSTVVMNAITFNAAYSFYPLATFENMTSRITLPSPYRSRQHLAFVKYQQRGWAMGVGLSKNEDEAVHDLPYHFYTTRWVGDRHCWTLPLDTSNIERYCQEMGDVDYQGKLACDHFALNGWALSRYERRDIPLLEHTFLIKSALGHGYAIPNECAYKFSMLERWFSRLSRLELSLVMEEDVRPKERRTFDLELQKVKDLCMRRCTCTYLDWKAKTYRQDGYVPCPAYLELKQSLVDWAHRPVIE